MTSLLRGEPDTVIRWAGPLILAGMILGVASARLEIPGIISAGFCVGLGAAGGSLVAWRTDRGLWMLAGLFLLVYCAIYGLMMYGKVTDLMRGPPGGGIGLIVDLAVATSLLSGTIRLLWRVTRYNWALSVGRSP